MSILLFVFSSSLLAISTHSTYSAPFRFLFGYTSALIGEAREFSVLAREGSHFSFVDYVEEVGVAFARIKTVVYVKSSKARVYFDVVV
jgi:hypothetical protein